MATTPEQMKEQAPAKVAEVEKSMRDELVNLKAALKAKDDALAEAVKKVESLESQAENQKKMLKREQRRAEAHAKAADRQIEGLSALAQEAQEQRTLIKKLARKEGAGDNQVACYRVLGEPAFVNSEGKLYPVGSIIKLAVNKDPSVNWAPIGAEYEGETDHGEAWRADDENAVTAEEVKRAVGARGAGKRPSDTSVA
jgi:hypothetical protein